YATATGMDPEKIVGHSRLQLLMKAPQPGGVVSSHIDDLMAHRPFRDFIYEARHGNPKCRWVSISGSPRFDAQGRFIGYRGFGRNVTPILSMQATGVGADDYKERELELARAKQQAEM